MARRQAFGLELELDRELPALAANGGAAGRPCRLELAEPEAIEAEWAAAGEAVEQIRDSRWPDGTLFMSVDHADGIGYRVHAPGHGLHLVADDGSRIRSALPEGPAWRYLKLLVAQVLPLAATLRGLELLHASAVTVDGRAVGLIAASGTGKSSVAVHLIARGAGFLTDDAMALERGPDAVTAHPGPLFANVHEHELAALPAGGRERLGSELGRSDKIHMEPPTAGGPVELGALVFLARHGDAPLQIGPVDEVARVLLGSTFVPHVRTPERLMTHLELCADLSRRVPCHAVHAPEDARAGDVAQRILDHLEAG